MKTYDPFSHEYCATERRLLNAYSNLLDEILGGSFYLWIMWWSSTIDPHHGNSSTDGRTPLSSGGTQDLSNHPVSTWQFLNLSFAWMNFRFMHGTAYICLTIAVYQSHLFRRYHISSSHSYEYPSAQRHIFLDVHYVLMNDNSIVLSSFWPCSVGWKQDKAIHVTFFSRIYVIFSIIPLAILMVLNLMWGKHSISNLILSISKRTVQSVF